MPGSGPVLRIGLAEQNWQQQEVCRGCTALGGGEKTGKGVTVLLE